MMCSISQKAKELFLGKIFVSISRVTETTVGHPGKSSFLKQKKPQQKKKRLEPLGLCLKIYLLCWGDGPLKHKNLSSSPRTQVKQTDKPNKKQGGPFLN